MKLSKNIILKFLISFFIILACLAFLYIKVLPQVVSSDKFINYVENSVKKSTGADLVIKNPQLKTNFNSFIEFKVDEVLLTKNETKMLDLQNFETALSLKILFRDVVIKKLVAQSIYTDADALQSLNNTEQKDNTKKSKWKVNVFDALLGVNNAEVLYSVNPETKIHFNGKHIGVNNAEKGKRNVYFKIFTDIFKNGKKVSVSISDNGNVFFENGLFHIYNCPLSINKSNIFIDMAADKKQNFDINLSSKKLNINDIIELLDTQIIENNIQESLVYFNDISGNLDFNLNIKNEDINGNFKLNNAKFKIKDADNVPVTLTKGTVNLTSDEVKLIGFEGFYDNNPENKLDFEGDVKDYLKSIDTNITGKAHVTNDFFKTHLSNITGTPLELNGDAPTRITLKSKNNIMDLNWFFMLKPGQNIKVGENYLPFEDSLRFMQADMHLEDMILDIKSLDYHIVPKDKILSREEYAQKRAEGEKFEPIFRMKSSIDLANNNLIKFAGFEIPEPLPSEILNAVLAQEIFQKGLISGNIMFDNRGSYPVLDGKLSMEKVLIPIQKMFVKSAFIEAKNNLIHLDAKGGYRRAKFDFNGDIVNTLNFPITVKNLNLSLESLDLYGLLDGFNNQMANAENVINTDEGLVSVENQNTEFDIRNIIIEKCKFHLDKGTYKEIVFGNLDADLTLNKSGVIDIKSNRFDFAEGQSSLRANFDLPNKKYNVKLGILNVNSDMVANALLDLKREITGKASGFMDLSTDDTMRLNGSIKFKISDGAIGKIGLVEYVLKCASLFRNTVTMINPATFADIVNVPDGSFEKITGDLKLNNNVVTGINIKTYSPLISTYIAGRYNIDNGDTSLRVYTKFSDSSKGITGFLRKISLNSLAKRISANNQSDVNYYAIELNELPEIDANEKNCQIYLTRIEGDVVNNNYISSLKKIK